MQDDSDYLGIVLDSDEKKSRKKKAPSKPASRKAVSSKPAPSSKPMPKKTPPQKSPVDKPLQSKKPPAQKPPSPKPIPQKPTAPEPVPSKTPPSKPMVQKPSPPDKGAQASVRNIFRDLNIQSARKPKASGRKGIFSHISAPRPNIKKGIAKERVPSGIPGLDEMIEGGFESDSTILLTGGPGSGKTTFVFQFLVNGAVMYDEPGLFISFEEEKGELFAHYKRFGWDLDALEKEKKVLFAKYAPHEVAEFLESGGGMLKDLIKDAGVKRIGIDSLSSFALLFKDEYEKRFNVLKFFDILRTWNCTVMLTSEKPVELTATYDDFGLEFLVDAVILIYNVRKGNIRERALEVLKMRGTNQMTKLCPLQITENGVVVFPSENIFSDISPVS